MAYEYTGWRSTMPPEMWAHFEAFDPNNPLPPFMYAGDIPDPAWIQEEVNRISQEQAAYPGGIQLAGMSNREMYERYGQPGPPTSSATLGGVNMRYYVEQQADGWYAVNQYAPEGWDWVGPYSTQQLAEDAAYQWETTGTKPGAAPTGGGVTPTGNDAAAIAEFLKLAGNDPNQQSLVQRLRSGTYTAEDLRGANGVYTQLQRAGWGGAGAQAGGGGAITPEHREGLRTAGYGDWNNPNLTEADFARISAGAQAGGGTTTTTGTYMTKNGVKTLDQMKRELMAAGWDGVGDVVSKYAQTTGGAVTPGGVQREPTTYAPTVPSGIPSQIGAGTPTVGAPSWFEEQQPGAFLPYLMQQRGIGLGTPLASYMTAQGPSAERAFQFATTAAQAGGQTAPSWTDFLPAWTQNRQGTPSVSQLMTGAQQATAGDPYWAALFGEGGLTAAQQMQLMAEAQKPGMTGPFLRWLMSNAAPALQQQWQMQVPTAEQPGTSFLQYALGKTGGY